MEGFQLKFDKLNDIAQSAIMAEIKKVDAEKLKFIGKTIFLLNQNKQDKVKIIVPYFDEQEEGIVCLMIEYLTNLLYLLELSQRLEYKDFTTNDFLFNFFASKNIEESNLKIHFRETQNDITKWQNDTYTRNCNFLPVFKENDDVDSFEITDIYSDKKLFSEIRKKTLINYPISLELEKTILVLTNKNDRLKFDFNSKVELIEYRNNQSKNETKSQLNLIKNGSIVQQFIITYPYYRNIRHSLKNKHKKSIEIEFRNRFLIDVFKPVQEEELYILPREFRFNDTIVVNPNQYFYIIETEHNYEFKDLYREIKQEWQNLDLNIYTYPFPKYFFLFITPNKSIKEWVDEFIQAFPAISQKGIYKKIENLIEMLLKVNWVEKLLLEFKEHKNINIVFTSLQDNKNQSKRLRGSFNNFKDYCLKTNNNLSFSNKPNLDKTNIIFYGYDSIKIINDIQYVEDAKLFYVLPDFSYFNQNPFIPLHVYDLQQKAYLSDIRRFLLLDFENFEKKINTERDILKQQLIQTLKEYRKRHQQPKDNEDIDLDEEKVVQEDIDLNEEEELIIFNTDFNEESEEDSKYIKFDFENERESSYTPPNDFLYIKRQNLLRIPANKAKAGDFMLDKKKLIGDLTSESILNKLQNIPESVKYFKYELGKIDSVFSKLRERGLEIATEYYFISEYTVKSKENCTVDTFKLPRKSDRVLICEFLNIPYGDMNIAYIAKYKNKKEISSLYKEMISFMEKNNLFTNTDKPETSDLLKAITNKYASTLSKEDNEFDLEDFTKSIIENIKNELDNYLVEIKKISYE